MRSALAVAMVACSAPAPASIHNQAPATPTLVLRMERTECGFQACPEYTIEIASDGTVRWHGEHGVHVLGDRVAHVRPADVRRLVTAFEQAGFFELHGPPPASRQDCSSGRCVTVICTATDQPTTRVTVVRDGVPHDYEAPPCGSALDRAEDLVDEVVGAKAWIGQRADEL